MNGGQRWRGVVGIESGKRGTLRHGDHTGHRLTQTGCVALHCSEAAWLYE
ncbi:hypothetical protein EXN66_Car002038 [Channa argus]|uniref:Uncharacterized protein n=1 Tax=Channa argus TaxID=215402 RepID=A0A6G1P8J8_CHAAH|nr:hypothetical protein EXN66_Car002038 [Channa argus]